MRDSDTCDECGMLGAQHVVLDISALSELDRQGVAYGRCNDPKAFETIHRLLMSRGFPPDDFDYSVYWMEVNPYTYDWLGLSDIADNPAVDNPASEDWMRSISS